MKKKNIVENYNKVEIKGFCGSGSGSVTGEGCWIRSSCGPGSARSSGCSGSRCSSTKW